MPATSPWLTLHLAFGNHLNFAHRLVAVCGSPDAAANASRLQLAQGRERTRTSADDLAALLADARDAAEREAERCARASVTLVFYGDDAYPPLLRLIPAAPLALWVRGALEPRDLHAVGVVGSRKASQYGTEQTARFATGLAGAGVTVVSGGARGIDGHAHKAALQHTGGRTLAVLGCGVDVAYPPEHAALFADVAERGAIVSEFKLGTRPQAEFFPRRNRLISGLSRGVLVVEADDKSGSLITARYAADEHGRPVFALPGRVDNPLSGGPHSLIRLGATLVTSFRDVLDGLPPLPTSAVLEAPSLFGPASRCDAATERMPAPRHADVPPPADLTDGQRAVLAALDGVPLSVDDLVQRCDLAAPDVMRDLTLLAVRGLAHRVDGRGFARGARVS